METLYPQVINFPVKVVHGSEIRRFTATSLRYQDLVDRIRALYGDLQVLPFLVKYQDEEQDWITLGSDSELKTAFNHYGNPVLRLTIDAPKNPPSPLQGIAAPVIPVVEQPIVSAKNDAPVDQPVILASTTQEPPTQVSPLFGPSFVELIGQLSDKKAVKRQFKNLKCAFKGFRFVQDVTVPDGTFFQPGSEFTKIWRIRNESEVDWPATVLNFRKGDRMSAPFEGIPIPPLPAGKELDISIVLRAPQLSGRYSGAWKLCGPFGRPFGEALKLKIKVSTEPPSASSSDEEEDKARIQWATQLDQLEKMGFSDKKKNLKFLRRFEGDMSRVTAKLLKKAQKSKNCPQTKRH